MVDFKTVGSSLISKTGFCLDDIKVSENFGSSKIGWVMFQLHQTGWNLIWFSFTSKKLIEIFAVSVYFLPFLVLSSLLLKLLRLSKSHICSQVLSLLFKMPSLKRNEKIEIFVCGRDYTRKNSWTRRKTWGVLKCSNCNFHIYTSEQLNTHMKQKHFLSKQCSTWWWKANSAVSKRRPQKFKYHKIQNQT